MENNSNHPVQSVLARIEQAAQRANRSAADITLVAVSKTKPIDAILAAYAAGVRHFGENRAAEFAEKAARLKSLARYSMALYRPIYKPVRVNQWPNRRIISMPLTA